MSTPQEVLHVRALTDSLVRAATKLMRSRSQMEALGLAADALHESGFDVTIMWREGELLRHSVLRHPPEPLRASEKLYGRPMQEVLIPLRDLPPAHPVFFEGRAVLTEDLPSVIRRIHPPQIAELVVAAFPRARSASAPIPVDGEVVGMLTIFANDLTPDTASVLELFGRMLGAALDNVRHHARAEEQLQKLQRLQSELLIQERLAMLGEAAGAMAHEVRNPLGVILNGVGILRHEPGMKSERSVLALGMVEEELNRLDSLVRDLLHAARPMELHTQPCDLAEWIRRNTPLLWTQVQAPGLRLELSLPLASAQVRADEGLLQLALEKLLRNAAHASPPGGRVRVAVEEGPEGYQLVVEDEGAGVTPTELQQIFRPFVGTRGLGTGLGLTVVERVAEAHSGSVRALSRHPRGLRLELSLPRG